MTVEEKQKIINLRNDGYGYKRIAKELNLPLSSIRYICEKGMVYSSLSGNCKNCGKKISSIKGKKRKIYCSDKCRLDWWNSHIKEVNKKAFYTITCKHCGKEFISYGNQKRVYCSHSCYIKDKKVASNE